MAIGYTWNVSTVDTYPTLDGNADVVYNVHWRLTAEDDANQDADGNNWTASSYGTQSVDTAAGPSINPNKRFFHAPVGVVRYCTTIK